MTKLRIGSKVEVLNNNVFPGMWMCGEIVAVDGDQYAIWYEFRGVTGKGTFQIVSKTSVRPYPPRSMALTCWVAGEITEVLDGGNWKTAVILEATGEEYYRIRLVGSCEELEDHGSSFRVRHAWEDDKWFVLGRAYRVFIQRGDDVLDGGNNIEVSPLRKLKRGHATDSPYGEASATGYKKRRLGKESLLSQKCLQCPPPLIQKVDAAYSQGSCCEKLFFPSSNAGIIENEEVNKAECLGDGLHSSEVVESDGIESSCGSCTIDSNSFDRVHSHCSTKCDDDGENDDLWSDAESNFSSGVWREKSFCLKVKLSCRLPI